MKNLKKQNYVDFDIEQGDKIQNFIRWKGFENSEQLFNYYYNVDQPICECGEPRKFISFFKGYYDFCSPSKHKEQIILRSVQKCNETNKSKNYNLDGYDNFLLNNENQYSLNFPYTDMFDGRILNNLDSLKRKSESGLTALNIEKECQICKREYIFNRFTYPKKHCKSKRCISLHTNNGEIIYSHLKEVELQEYLDVKNKFKLDKKSGVFDEFLKEYLFHRTNLSHNNQLKAISGLLVIVNGIVLERKTKRSDFSFKANNLHEHIKRETCVICNGKYDYADLMYSYEKKIFYYRRLGQKYTCSRKCYNEIVSNQDFYPSYKDIGPKISKIISEKIYNGVFTPCVTNSWQKSRTVIDGIPFRSSWEQYFFIFNKNILNQHLEYEKLRIPYFDPLKNKNRTYIVDFIDFEKRIVYEIKPKGNVDERTIQKENSLKKWCCENNYLYEFISNEWFKNNYDKNVILGFNGELDKKDMIRKLKQFEDKT